MLKNRGKPKVQFCGICLRDSEAEQRALQLFAFLLLRCKNYSSAPESNRHNPPDHDPMFSKDSGQTELSIYPSPFVTST